MIRLNHLQVMYMTVIWLVLNSCTGAALKENIVPLPFIKTQEKFLPKAVKYEIGQFVKNNERPHKILQVICL